MPAELLCCSAIDNNVIYEVKWWCTAPCTQLIINGFVYTWVWFAHMHEVRSKTVLKH